jgi:hypothetical protein
MRMDLRSGIRVRRRSSGSSLGLEDDEREG